MADTHPPLSPQELEKAITQLVVAGGDTKKAARALGLDGLEVDAKHLRRIRDHDHREAFREAEAIYAAEREEAIVHAARQNAIEAGRVEADLIQNLPARARAMEPKDAAAAVRALADVKAKNVDKLLALTGRGQQQPEQPGDLGQLVEALVAKGVLKPKADQPPVDDPKVTPIRREA